MSGDPALRTVKWGLPVGKPLPVSAINTGVVHVTPSHIDLLTAWRKLLADERRSSSAHSEMGSASRKATSCFGDKYRGCACDTLTHRPADSMAKAACR